MIKQSAAFPYTEEARKLTFRALGLRRSETRNCGLCVVYIQKYAATLLIFVPDTGRIFSQPLLVLFKRDKNIGNFLPRSAFQTSDQPGSFICARTMQNISEKIFGTQAIHQDH